MNRIRDLREERELTYVDISRSIGIDRKTLSNYENEKTLPDSQTLIKLADFFGVSIDYLVGRTDSDFYTKKTAIAKINKIQAELDDLKKSL